MGRRPSESTFIVSAILIGGYIWPHQAAGVPTVPGSDGLIESEDEAMEVARQVGHPHLCTGLEADFMNCNFSLALYQVVLQAASIVFCACQS